jgi:hypothetical protein
VLWRQAVTLDWRLLWRSLQRASGEFWAVVGLTLMSAMAVTESSLQLGEQLARNQLGADHAALLVALRTWAAFLAAFVFVLAAGELSFMRRLLADLSLRPVSPSQAFMALQAVSIVGRHTLVLLSAGLPLLILSFTWLGGVPLVAAVGATFVLLRLPVPILTIAARAASGSMTVALTSGLAIVALVGGLWLAAPGLVTAALPPFLAARILMQAADASAWGGLAAWTLALAALDYWTMGSQSAPVPAQAVETQRLKPLPAAVRSVAGLTGCSPVLLHGELLRLSRWRRYQLSWLVCAGLMLLLFFRQPENPGLLHVVVFLLVPVHVGGSTLANVFAADGAGFLAMVLSPVSLGAILRAKVIAVLLFTMVAELACLGILVALGFEWTPIAAGVLLSAGLFMWTAAVGTLTSVLFPSASDPQTVGGSLVNTSAAVVILVGSGLYLGPAARLAYLVYADRLSLETGAVATAGLIGAAAIALMAVSRIAPRLAAMRVESMTAAITANPGTRA